MRQSFPQRMEAGVLLASRNGLGSAPLGPAALGSGPTCLTESGTLSQLQTLSRQHWRQAPPHSPASGKLARPAGYILASVLLIARQILGNFSTLTDLGFLICKMGIKIQLSGTLETEDWLILLGRDLKPSSVTGAQTGLGHITEYARDQNNFVTVPENCAWHLSSREPPGSPGGRQGRWRTARQPCPLAAPHCSTTLPVVPSLPLPAPPSWTHVPVSP